MTIDVSATLKRRDLYDPGLIFEGRPSGRHVDKGPVFLTDAQCRTVEVFAALVSVDLHTAQARRAAFRARVLDHLAGGRPGDAAVKAACIAAAPTFIDQATRDAHRALFDSYTQNHPHRLRATAPAADDRGIW
jgi:hypothetical protein